MSIPRSQRALIEAAFRQETARPAGLPASLPAPIGPYRIIRQLGAGGMGAVYEAEQEHPLRRCVALKVIKLGMDTEEIVARFEAERQALAVMDHPNIARVFDAGATDQGRPYFVMEYVPGVRITQYCDQQRLRTVERLALFVQVCHAIQHAHQKGVIHRDIKPSNVLVTEHDGQPVPKVIDFGVAKAIDVQLLDQTMLTGEGRPVGTPAYMSPEQLEPRPYGIDTRTDVYALGMLLYEMLVGTLPYGDTSLKARALADVQRIIREEEPTRPSTRVSRLGPDAARAAAYRRTSPNHWRRQLRGDLDWIVMKALEKDRERRYAGAAEFAEDVQRHLRQEPVTAGSPSTAYRMQKFVRRNRALVAGTAAVLVVLVAGIVTSTVFALRETQARHAVAWQAHLGNIAAAAAALATDDAGRIRQYLGLSPPEFHATWEWRYLNAAADESLATFVGHTGEVWSVAFDPGGELLASGGADRSIRIWNRSTGTVLHTLIGHQGTVCSVAFSPDGRRLASASEDQTVRIWEVSGEGAPLTLRMGGAIYGVTFSPDGTRLAAAGQRGYVGVWDAQRGVELAAMVGHTANVFCVAFSADGQRLASASLDRTVRIWQTTLAAPLVQTAILLEGQDFFVRSVAFSPDGQRIVSGSKDGKIRMWDLSEDDPPAAPRVLKGHRGVVQSVAFSPDSRCLASGADDGTVRTWDGMDGEPLRVLRGHTGFVQSVAFSRDGSYLASACRQDMTVRLWDSSMRRPRNILPHDEWAVLGEFRGQGYLGTFSRGSTQLGNSMMSSAFVWDTVSGEQLTRLPEDAWGILLVTCTRDGGRWVSVARGGTLDLWEGQGRPARRLQLANCAESQPALLFAKISPDRETLAALLADGSLRRWRLPDAEPMPDLPGRDLAGNHIAYNADGSRLAVGTSEGQVRVWNFRDSNSFIDLRGHGPSAVRCAFNPDGTRLASAAFDDKVCLWDLRSERLVRASERFAGTPSLVAFSRDGVRMAYGLDDGTLHIWRTSDGEELHLAKAHAGRIRSVTFSPDGSRLATGSEDGTVRIWEPRTGVEVLVLQGHEGIVTSVAFDIDGTQLASSSDDRTVRIWDTAPYRERYSQRRDERAARETKGEPPN